jgi:hypothetical protein
LSFIIYFDLFFIGLSWSHDLDREFDRLTQVNWANLTYIYIYILENCFSQTIFFKGSLSYLWTRQIDQVKSGHSHIV